MFISMHCGCDFILWLVVLWGFGWLVLVVWNRVLSITLAVLEITLDMLAWNSEICLPHFPSAGIKCSATTTWQCFWFLRVLFIYMSTVILSVPHGHMVPSEAPGTEVNMGLWTAMRYSVRAVYRYWALITVPAVVFLLLFCMLGIESSALNTIPEKFWFSHLSSVSRNIDL